MTVDNFGKHGVDLKIPGTGAFLISVRADLRTPTKCKNCGESIFWARTRKKKLMPIEKIRDTYICHYNTCKKV